MPDSNTISGNGIGILVTGGTATANINDNSISGSSADAGIQLEGSDCYGFRQHDYAASTWRAHRRWHYAGFADHRPRRFEQHD